MLGGSQSVHDPRGVFASHDPATGEAVWEGAAATPADCRNAVDSARRAWPSWAATPLEERIAVVRRYRDILAARAGALAVDIACETGKPLWEASAEVASMVGKIEISIAAQAERAGERRTALAFGTAVLRHRPHGVMAVLGPYNFPGHLPNGHIVPALLAGDVVVFKPSELSPLVGQRMCEAWQEAGLPEGVLTLLQGGREVGEALLACDIDGLLFTGSAGAGAQFRRQFAERPAVMIALELGGNNPLIAWDGEPAAIASIVVQSAFITSGQRCSCARRLIVPDSAAGDAIIEATLALADRLIVGAWNDPVEPFMGPLISPAAAARAIQHAAGLEALGARWLRRLDTVTWRPGAFLSPGLIDVTGLAAPDEEIFAPLLQVVRVPDFAAAIDTANATAFGLAAGLISSDDCLWARFLDRARAGVINRNRPTTGASGTMPFGGLGASGNHRPSAYYATDYCAYPVASFEATEVIDLSADIRGLRL